MKDDCVELVKVMEEVSAEEVDACLSGIENNIDGSYTKNSDTAATEQKVGCHVSSFNTHLVLSNFP